MQDWYARVGLEVIKKRGTQSFDGVRISYRSSGHAKVGYIAERIVLTDRPSA